METISCFTTTTTTCPVYQVISLSQKVRIAICATKVFRHQEKKDKKTFYHHNQYQNDISALSLRNQEKNELFYNSKIKGLAGSISGQCLQPKSIYAYYISPYPKATKIPLLESKGKNPFQARVLQSERKVYL